MMNDTVREEVQSNIIRGPAARAVVAARSATAAAVAVRPEMPAPAPRPVLDPPLAPPPKRVETTELVAPKTSPTLVDFQNKATAVPEWRLQMQNAVQQRRKAVGGSVEVAAPAATVAVAAKVEAAPRVAAAAKEVSDPRMAAALKRIEQSRRSFADPPTAKKPAAPAKPAQRAFPFDVVSRGTATPVATPPKAAAAAPVAFTPPAPMPAPARPTIVKREEPVLKRDTNKLPPIKMPSGPLPQSAKPAERAVSGELKPPVKASGPLDEEQITIPQIKFKAENIHIDGLEHETEEFYDEIEDLAPFSMRFGAGLFDLIIAAFASALLLSPLAFTSSQWFTPAALMTYAGTVAIFMFLYMTISLGFYGKTMGMRLFSLELVDAAENEYPTLHQAAVNSSVFLLSLVFAGSGFLTVFFNEEKRALHDLMSGTILVREF